MVLVCVYVWGGEGEGGAHTWAFRGLSEWHVWVVDNIFNLL